MENSKSYTDKTLSKFFSSVENGVAGVLHIKSGKPGPVAGITVCTHGNEPSGLRAFAYLIDTLDVQASLIKGELYLIVNNLEAAQKSVRYIDADMNRLSADVMIRNDLGYEGRRARELAPVWSRFDAALDIHSTSVEAEPMVFQIGPRLHVELLKGMPIKKVITNIDAVQRGKPACAFYGRSDARVFAIETGQHVSQAAVSCACVSVKAFLQNLAMLPGDTIESEIHEEYRVIESVVLPNNSYKIVGTFPNFVPVTRGMVIARGDGPDIVMPFDGHTIMHNGKAQPDDILSEALFITEPVKRYQ